MGNWEGEGQATLTWTRGYASRFLIVVGNNRTARNRYSILSVRRDEKKKRGLAVPPDSETHLANTSEVWEK